jgi:hypothetical protein
LYFLNSYKMKKICLLLISVIICFISCKTIKPAAQPGKNSEPPAVNYSDQSTWLLGYFNPGQLTHEPHAEWYLKGYDAYQFNTGSINTLLDIDKSGITIKIVMGTWCPDSRREVPRFMRILDLWQFPVSQLTFIGVDNAKLSPVGEYDKLDIQRVPTFIVYKNNIEAGRIIENPVTSLEQDMVNILTRNE